MTATIEFEVSGHVATVTLDRPAQMNSFNQAMANEITAAWQRVREDDDIHVAIVRANGERAFCTGIDVSAGRWWGTNLSSTRRIPARTSAPNHIRSGNR